jgi:hypothetical protein
MVHFIMSLIGIAAAVMFISMIGLAVRQVIALIKGDEFEFMRLTTPYDEAEHKAIVSYSHRGVTKEIFAKYWEREQKRNPDALPLDAYYSIMDELACAHEPDPTIWS